MSLWERINGDDLAYLALVWLLIVGAAMWLYVYAARNWERRKHLPPPTRDCARYKTQARGVYR